mmetsp:Transcript_42810/g.88055  ORF Transcript_42810/g.88055 Transcript_42810/m.88055 type:complete len:123 (+) Transcript_42810:132-500(+)
MLDLGCLECTQLPCQTIAPLGHLLQPAPCREVYGIKGLRHTLQPRWSFEPLAGLVLHCFGEASKFCAGTCACFAYKETRSQIRRKQVGLEASMRPSWDLVQDPRQNISRRKAILMATAEVEI